MDKIWNYSKRKTLENIWEWYEITLKNKLSVLWIKEWTFKKWDIIKINEIKLKKDKPHHVKFSVKRGWEKIKDLEMSGWVFLKAFIESINPKDIIYKTQEDSKEEVKNILNKKD